MKKHVIRGVLFAALTSAGACAISDAPVKEGGAAPQLEEVNVVVDETMESAGDMAASAATYLARNLMAAGTGDRFEVTSSGSSHEGAPFMRMAQVHEGVPVFGADVVVHTHDAAFRSARGNVLSNLEGFDVTPSLDKGKAFETAKAQYLSKVTDRAAKLEYSREQTQLVILPMDGGAPRLAWHISFYTEQQGGVQPGLWNVFVDAQDGSVLKQFNAIHTLSQASGPGGNAKVARTWTSALDVEPSGTQFMMDTARLVTTNMRNGTTGTGTVVVGPLNPIGDAPINDAHGFSEATLNMLRDWQGENSINGAGFKVRSRVHYSTSYENAFWDGAQMTYGDGASTFYPLSGSADVAGHEINHGYTSFHSNLTYSGQSGGMNESFSDISGELTEAYIKNAAPDMLVGADIFKSATGALRYMCNPTQDGRSIDHISRFTTGIDVHLSSGIMNKAFCLIARRFASGSPTGAHTLASTQRAGRPFYLANKQIWTAGSTFQQGCQGVWDAAVALGYTTAEKCAIRQSWIDVGLTCGDAALCGGGGGTCNPTTNAATGLPRSIPDNNATGISSVINVTTAGPVASVALSLNINHTYRGDLVVTLTSPAGTVYSVSNRAGGSADNLVLTSSAITAFNGQVSNGAWTLKVSDRAAVDTGNLASWSLAIGRVCPP